MYCDEEKINALCGERVVFEVDPAVVIPHVREALSRYVCKFPLEWNASLYTLCSKGNCVDCESPLQCECFPLRFKKHIDTMQLGDMIIAFESKYLMSDYLGENDIPLGNETSDIHKIISEKLFLNGGLLKRQKFKQESVSDPYHKLIVEPQKLSADKWVFWIKGHNGNIIDGKIILQGKITLDIYEKNPYLSEYTAPESAVAVTNRLLRFEKEMSIGLKWTDKYLLSGHPRYNPFRHSEIYRG